MTNEAWPACQTENCPKLKLTLVSENRERVLTWSVRLLGGEALPDPEALRKPGINSRERGPGTRLMVSFQKLRSCWRHGNPDVSL